MFLSLDCLLHWLEQDPSCPTCRRQLLKDNSENSNSQERQTRDNSGGWISWSWTGWSRLLQQSIDIPAAENSQLESLAEQVIYSPIVNHER